MRDFRFSYTSLLFPRSNPAEDDRNTESGSTLCCICIRPDPASLQRILLLPVPDTGRYVFCLRQSECTGIKKSASEEALTGIQTDKRELIQTTTQLLYASTIDFAKSAAAAKSSVFGLPLWRPLNSPLQ